MPSFLPYRNVTIVSSLSPEEISHKLESCIRPREEALPYTMRSEVTFLGRRRHNPYDFEGWVKKQRFYIYKTSDYPEHFTPLVIGKIEETSLGSIIFIHYRLMSGTLFFTILASVIFLIVGIVFLFLQKNILSFGLTLLFFLGSYLVMLLNFQQKLKITQNLLEKNLRGDI